MSAHDRALLETKIRALQLSIKEKRKDEAKLLAQDLQEVSKPLLKKTAFQQITEFIFAIAFALVFATIFRQMYLDPMEIPTGSMRPTFREQDRVVVSKMPFGINIPLTPGQFYFDSSLVKRGDIIVFTAENMEVDDPKTTYFGLFPGYKRLVKRCIAKPGDTIYFYGGKVYGIDSDGQGFIEWMNPSTLSVIDHIPFIRFEGKVTQGLQNGELLINQMNMPLGRIQMGSYGVPKGEIRVNNQWISDKPYLATKPHNQIVTYSDFWGFNNFANIRMLNAKQAPQGLDPANAYLELHHTPQLNQAQIYQGGSNRLFPMLASETSYIPLQQTHLDALKNALYTSRFVVKDEQANFYNYQRTISSPYAPKMPGVPDGSYEFYNGIAYKVGFQGILTALEKSHPIYPKNVEQLQTLVNFGIEFNTYYGPNAQATGPYPNRFAYFQDGALFVMGYPIFQANDPILTQFIANELDKQSKTTPTYIAFVDKGAPLKNGVVDPEFVKTFGFKIPQKMYLGLGDNYSMSADSREFGLIPEENLEGSPWVLMWPPGPRWGLPLQPDYPLFTLPKALLGIFALIVAALWTIWKAKQQKRFR
ncbi:MAG: signal peptidase I [Parachlamydiales bacterium]|nr:signal peptidase I [Parachlamydiales bacterium]